MARRSRRGSTRCVVRFVVVVRGSVVVPAAVAAVLKIEFNVFASVGGGGGGGGVPDVAFLSLSSFVIREPLLLVSVVSCFCYGSSVLAGGLLLVSALFPHALPCTG